jgi:hypothetical protein
MSVDESIQQRRLEILTQHVKAERVHNVAGTVETFAHPRYEVIPTREVFDGSEEVAKYLSAKADIVGSIDVTTPAMYFADNAVIVETETYPAPGDHRRENFGPPVRGCSIFFFDGDELVCERMYVDLADAARLSLRADAFQGGGWVTESDKAPAPGGEAH